MQRISIDNCTEREKFIQVIYFDFLMVFSDIHYLLNNVAEFFWCFAIYWLPPFPTEFPKTMIMNSDYKSGPGKHWMAVVVFLEYEFVF